MIAETGSVIVNRTALLTLFLVPNGSQSNRVKERLPEEGQKVFVLTMCCGVSRILIERFYKTNAFDKDNRWIFGNSIVLAWFPIPSFDDILEANRDVLERIKQKGD